MLLLWDRLIAADPGSSRLLLAARVTLSVALTVVVLAIGATLYNVPITVAVLGAIVAMQAGLAVNDPEPRLTTLLVPLPGSVGIVLGAIFASRGILADLVFLAVLFTAVSVRLLGPRWTAFGTIAMMTYFFALFLDATPAQLPALILSVIVGGAFTYLVRFVLLPDRPVWIARRTVAAFEARIRFVALAAQALLETHDPTAARRRLLAATGRLSETATSIEARLGMQSRDELRIVFDAELAAEDLAAAAHALRDAAAPVPRALRLALVALVGRRIERASRLAGRTAHDPGVHPAARAVAAAIVDLGRTIGHVDATAASLALSDAPWGASAGEQQPVMRQALQVTIASAAAIVIGEALSPQRWSWAVLAAYFVFLGTASSGETAARAWSRIGGTALGVAAGVLCGHLAAGHPWIDSAAIFACMFLGIYFLRISHMLMIFFITADLALMYAVLGRFSDGLLGIRLVETAVGAICGGVAATLIFPTRTRDVVRAHAIEALDAARTAIHTSIAHLMHGGPPIAPLDAARHVEECVQRFVSRAKPALSSPALLGASHEFRRWIVSLSACSYYMRMLARSVDRYGPVDDERTAVLLQSIDASISTNIGAAIGRIDGRDDDLSVDTRATFDKLQQLETATSAPQSAFSSAVSLLERFDRTVARLARDQGTVVELAVGAGAGNTPVVTPDAQRR